MKVSPWRPPSAGLLTAAVVRLQLLALRQGRVKGRGGREIGLCTCLRWTMPRCSRSWPGECATPQRGCAQVFSYCAYLVFSALTSEPVPSACIRELKGSTAVQVLQPPCSCFCMWGRTLTLSWGLGLLGRIWQRKMGV